jgi:hypothetical protein
MNEQVLREFIAAVKAGLLRWRSDLMSSSRPGAFSGRRRAPRADAVQLSAVTGDVGTGIFGSDCVERARLPDDAVHDHNRAGRDHSGCSETRIGDCVCAPHDDCIGHNLGPFAIWARRKPERV